MFLGGSAVIGIEDSADNNDIIDVDTNIINMNDNTIKWKNTTNFFDTLKLAFYI